MRDGVLSLCKVMCGCVLFVAGGLLAIRSAHAAEAISPVHAWTKGDEAPRFTLKVAPSDAAGLALTKYMSLDDFVGSDARIPKKAVVLSFFASYCEPCVREVPYLAALEQIYGSMGVQILLVTIDTEQDKVKVAQDVVAGASARFPLLTDRFHLVAKRYHIDRLPALFVIDSAGQIQSTTVGDDRDTLRRVHDDIRRVIGIPASAPISATLQPYFAQ